MVPDFARPKYLHAQPARNFSAFFAVFLGLLNNPALAQQSLPEVADSGIGFSSPAAALAALHTRADVEFSMVNGWSVVS